MLRPAPSARARRLLAACALAFAVPFATAQTRALPENVEVGRLQIGVFPEGTLDGRPVLLGPGLRIHDDQNRIVVPASVSGVRPVAYRRGAGGELIQAWLLSDAEYRELAARIAAERRAAGQR